METLHTMYNSNRTPAVSKQKTQMLFRLFVLCLLLAITARAECPCSKCTQCLTGLLVKSASQDVRMDCYAVEPLAAKNSSSALLKVGDAPQVAGLIKFIKGLRGELKEHCGGADTPSNTHGAKEGGDIPAIEPPGLSDANVNDSADSALIQECAGAAFYVSKQPIASGIADKKCWKKLASMACPAGKELVLLRGLLQCIKRTVLKEEATKNLECFE